MIGNQLFEAPSRIARCFPSHGSSSYFRRCGHRPWHLASSSRPSSLKASLSAASSASHLTHSHLDVGHLARGPQLVEPQLVAAVGLAPMDELDPREVVEVPVLAGDEEPGRDHRGRLALLVADPVDVAAPVLAVRVEPQLEQARLDRGQQPAVGADLPAGKRGDRDADVRRVVEGAGRDTRRVAASRAASGAWRPAVPARAGRPSAAGAR